MITLSVFCFYKIILPFLYYYNNNALSMSLAFIFHTHFKTNKNTLTIFWHIVYKFKILNSLSLLLIVHIVGIWNQDRTAWTDMS